MPELPDVTICVERLTALLKGRVLDRVQLLSPFVLRSVEPAPSELHGRRLVGARRIGKRIALEFSDAHFLVVHLMIAGRLRMRPAIAKPNRTQCLAAFYFGQNALWLTEASKKKRAALHVVRGENALAAMDPGGLDVLRSDLRAFSKALRREHHTVKRALTDPKILDGIGNAYSDEILHLVRLSPFCERTSSRPRRSSGYSTPHAPRSKSGRSAFAST